MPDLLIRPSGLDAALMAKMLTPVTGRPSSDFVVHPRLIVPAHVAAKKPEFAATARRAGVPMLVDPETYYLQDHQYTGDAWAQLPFARPGVLTPTDLTRALARDLAVDTINAQINAGATHLLTPYVHIKNADDGWLERQIALYRATRTMLDIEQIALPTVAVIDIGWRLLDRRSWPAALRPLLSAIGAAGFDEIALCASNVDDGVRPEDRAASMLATVRTARATAPVIAFNQGLLGELCVAAGAIGYSTGIGWRERPDTGARMRDRRTAPDPDRGRSPRPVYIGKLGRSIPAKTVAAMLPYRSIAPDLPCPPSGCCQEGAAGLIGDARWHALYSRVSSLRTLAETERQFRWAQLAKRADEGIDLAERINIVARREDLPRVKDTALRAIATCAKSHHARMRRQAA